ncbi:MAG: hypothetical protein NPINA01_09850 [Nitrospinaceae bacterium]|nr:MAG: hypothetical protein NPINA01_09850 [Nitrospinaceae bacterium]
MKKILAIGLLAIFLNGCATKSISETGYAQKEGHGKESSTQTELNELEVIGVSDLSSISEKAISEALAASGAVNLPKGDSILLVQSGADFPDSQMVESMSEYWDINILSGSNNRYTRGDLNKTLRYVAASGGNKHLVVYWGIVETAKKNLDTKSVSWVPFLGWSIPDENTQMRIRLKFAIIDVEKGSWKIFQPSPVEEEFMTSIIGRKGKEQQKVIELKKLVYSNAAKQIFAKFN